jgi:condensin complex subunit 2
MEDYGFDFDFGDDGGDVNDQELMDPFADAADGDDYGNDGERDTDNTSNNADTDIVTTISTNQENELLSYFDTTLSKNWAGPEHWKLRKPKASK